MKTKDKQAEQRAKKEAHKKQLINGKNRRTAPDFQIPAPTRQEHVTFLIVCEGLNTEPDYFGHFQQYFRRSAVKIISVGGAGNTIRVVERAHKECIKIHYDQVWVVFDKDDFPADHFNNAIIMADNSGYGVAYSNQSFEYWFILHFEDHQGGPMHRNQYSEKLNGYLGSHGLTYNANGSKNISDAFFRVLMGIDEKKRDSRLNLAIKRAKKGLLLHENTISPALAESTTRVHELVEELLKYVSNMQA